MSKFDEYNKMSNAICSYGYDVSEYRSIPYGIQFTITFKGAVFSIRIYESKKKGVTIDYSQVRNHKVQNAIEEMMMGKYQSESSELYESDKLDVELIGTDESGKGDYFGALCVSGVWGNRKIKKQLSAIGVKDCKKLDDYEIVKLANKIRAIEGIQHYTMSLYPEEFNRLTVSTDNNMNSILGILHMTVVQNLAHSSNCKLALIDQFANDSLILDLEATKYKTGVTIEQRPKAESNIIVAAASILARDAFLSSISTLSNDVNLSLPTGCNAKVIDKGKQLVNRHEVSTLVSCAKISFENTTKSILGNKALVLF